MHRRQLPVLNPCHESWDAMDGDAKRRHCESCDQDVIDLSAMSERDAKKIVERARKRSTCVRYRVGADGMVMFAPNGAPVSPPIFGLKPIALGLGLLVGAAAIPSTTVMGEVAPPTVITQPIEPAPPPQQMLGQLAVDPLPPPPPVEKKPRKPSRPPKPEHVVMGKIAFDPDR